MATNDDCLRALQRAATELGESPSKAQYEALGFMPSASTILRQCGGWNAAKEEAGLETNISTGSRTLPKPEDVDLPDGMVWEELSQDQRWHNRHKREYTPLDQLETPSPTVGILDQIRDRWLHSV